MTTPDELGRALGEALYSPPVFSMRVLVPRPLGDDFEACQVALHALVEDVRREVAERGLRTRPSGSVTAWQWAVAFQTARVGGEATPDPAGSGWTTARAVSADEPSWGQVLRAELVGGALPEWASARMYEVIAHLVT